MKKGGVLRTVLWFAGAYVVAFGVSALEPSSHLWSLLRALTDDDDLRFALARLYYMAATVFGVSYIVSLALATVLAPAGFAGRVLLRAAVRAGYRDRLDPVRAFSQRHPRIVTALLALPAVAWAWFIATRVADGGGWDRILPGAVLPAAIVVAAQAALARRGWRALLAPTLPDAETRGERATAEGFTFDAVAVTTETLAAVGGLAALSVAMVTAAFTLSVSTLVHHPLFRTALLAYLALALGGAALFRRTSRIDVGFDGIFISGSARRRFVSFADVDGVRASQLGLELLRGERVVLRLQLHGEDATRRDALADRIRAAIAAAEAQRREPAVDFLRSASTEEVGRAAGGSSTYRESAPTRDKLWDLLESPAVDAAGRKAAASALAKDGTTEELTRLRVAAEHCADPSVRARIEEVLDDQELPEEPEKHRMVMRGS
ncbi:MAG: hypothetical protein KIT84_01865 [Labilithrix sp.]|nr:hypothetical protein [Labilithrix sp.]MCW5809734.1 hypothetical protein [Labilithrix sp.]